MLLIKITIGVMLLILGRKLFWLMVGGVGFLAGTYLSTLLFQGASEWVGLIFALAIGIAGVVLTMLIQKVGITVAGFVIGGMIFSGIISNVLGGFDLPGWLFFLIGGGLGMLLTVVIFEWSLILFSSIAGAWIISDALSAYISASMIVFLILFCVGIIIQFRMKNDSN